MPRSYRSWPAAMRASMANILRKVTGTTTMRTKMKSVTLPVGRAIASVAVLSATAVLSGCTEGSAHAANASRVSVSAGSIARPDSESYPVVRALYVNRWRAQSPKAMQKLFRIADSSEINGLVIDMKDEFGLNFRPKNSKFAAYAGDGHGAVGDVRALVDSVKAHGLIPIARVVVFKDPVTAAATPAWTIRRPDGTAWMD